MAAEASPGRCLQPKILQPIGGHVTVQGVIMIIQLVSGLSAGTLLRLRRVLPPADGQVC